jgi:hypothetical protein
LCLFDASPSGEQERISFELLLRYVHHLYVGYKYIYCSLDVEKSATIAS